MKVMKDNCSFYLSLGVDYKNSDIIPSKMQPFVNRILELYLKCLKQNYYYYIVLLYNYLLAQYIPTPIMVDMIIDVSKEKIRFEF